MPQIFSCYLVEKDGGGKITAGVKEISRDDLPPGEVLIRVNFSSLNYKDALAASGHPGVVRNFPHVPGIDAAGVVEESRDVEIVNGQNVLVTGYDLGAGAWGGWAEFIRVPARWVVPLPDGLSLRESMIYGTAGFTAARSLDALLRHEVTPDKGQVVVTGASGGVGSLAVALLAKAGYHVAAVTGKQDAGEFLRELGAEEILGRDQVDDQSDKPLLGGRWAGAVDTVGGNILPTLLRSTRRGGCVTACGLVAGHELNLTVYPFILRGVALAGIDSAECPRPKRLQLWEKMAGDWKPSSLEEIATNTVNLNELPRAVEEILEGRVMGRVVVEPRAGD